MLAISSRSTELCRDLSCILTKYQVLLKTGCIELLVALEMQMLF